MTGQREFVDDMKLELAELSKLGVISKAKLAKALKYVTDNAEEFSDPNMYTDVTSAVDSVVMLVDSCGSGRCE